MTIAQLECLSDETHSQSKVAFGLELQDKADSFSFGKVLRRYDRERFVEFGHEISDTKSSSHTEFKT